MPFFKLIHYVLVLHKTLWFSLIPWFTWLWDYRPLTRLRTKPSDSKSALPNGIDRTCLLLYWHVAHLRVPSFRSCLVVTTQILCMALYLIAYLLYSRLSVQLSQFEPYRIGMVFLSKIIMRFDTIIPSHSSSTKLNFMPNNATLRTELRQRLVFYFNEELEVILVSFGY